MRLMAMRSRRSESKGVVIASKVETLSVGAGVVGTEEGNGLDQGFERRDGADDDGDAGFND